jgi:hypothetical protein
MGKHLDGKRIAHTIRFNERIYIRLKYYWLRTKEKEKWSFNSMIEFGLYSWVESSLKEYERRLEENKMLKEAMNNNEREDFD